MESQIKPIKQSVLILTLIIIVLPYTLVIESCKKYVEIGPPHTQIVRSAVFTSNETATAAQTVIYSQIELDLNYYLSIYLGCAADEFISYDQSLDAQQFFTNSLIPSNGIVYNLWSSAYRHIYQANAVLEGLSDNTAVTPQVKKQLVGEAKFIRAFCYFYLANIFNDVPIVKSTNYEENRLLSRSNISEVYKFIVKDLQEAKDSLNAYYVSSDGLTETSERVRPSKAVASALLAKVYLYLEDWKNAEQESNSIIDQGKYELSSDLNSAFTKDSKEAIWQLSNNTNTYAGFVYILLTPSFVALNPDLLSSFETGDLRKQNWVSYLIQNQDTFYYPYKYKAVPSSNPVEYTIIFRLSEQYLIRAEARVKQKKFDIARNDINVIRNRSSLPSISFNDETSLSLAIEKERNTELFSELGHRWLDLKRTKRLDLLMPEICQRKGSKWESHQKVFPIPQQERSTDPNLTQNPGY